MKGFKEFILRGNVIDLAVAVVIGAAFTAIVTSLVTNIFNPLIGALFKAPMLDEALKVDIPTVSAAASADPAVRRGDRLRDQLPDHRRGRLLLPRPADQPPAEDGVRQAEGDEGTPPRCRPPMSSSSARSATCCGRRTPRSATRTARTRPPSTRRPPPARRACRHPLRQPPAAAGAATRGPKRTLATVRPCVSASASGGERQPPSAPVRRLVGLEAGVVVVRVATSARGPGSGRCRARGRW